MSERPSLMLACTVGGTRAPIEHAIRHWQPSRVWFVASGESRVQVDAISRELEAAGGSLGPGACDVLEVSSSQSLRACIRDLRDREREILRWVRDDPSRKLVVDYTGGTKPMSAALALVASRWTCVFSYVGGEQRTKGGVGVVENGTERMVDEANPWDALGYRAIEEAASLFDRRAYAAAAALLDRTMKRSTDPTGRSVVSTFKTLAQAYDAWERFDHKRARDQIERALQRDQDLRSLPSEPAHAQRLLEVLEEHFRWLGQIGNPNLPQNREILVLDLVGNARRRAEEGRYDDAVARLYRALEAAAQASLATEYGVEDTGRVPLEKIPENLRSQWSWSSEQTIELGLQNAYRLLREWGDPLGTRFAAEGLDHHRESLLAARNQSILAHGFVPIPEKVYRQLREKVERVLAFEHDPPDFPRIRGTLDTE